VRACLHQSCLSSTSQAVVHLRRFGQDSTVSVLLDVLIVLPEEVGVCVCVHVCGVCVCVCTIGSDLL
jgi:hypothetical protein